MKEEDIEKRIDEGFALQQEGFGQAAEAIYREVLESAPENGDALSLLGVAAMQAGRTREAADLIRRAIRAIPGRDHLHNNLGAALKAEGQKEEAIEAFGRALSINPQNTGALNNLGNLLKETGRIKEAAAAYRRALAIDGEDPVTLGNLGAALTESGDPEQALPLLEKAVLRSPGSAGALNNLGNALKSAGRTEAAMAAYIRSLAINRKNAATHKNLGDLHLSAGRPREAAEAFGRALALDPNHPVARHLLNALTGAPSDRAPRDYVRALFDQYSPGFDQHLVASLKYTIPERLFASLTGACGGSPSFENAVDLGCGSGLTGRCLRGATGRLTGVDLSAGMLAAAKEKKIYDRLVQADIVEYLDGTDEKFDLITATDTFIYVGDLDPVFSTAQRSTKAGTIFAFSTERWDGQGYHLLPTGRYAQSPDYIRSLAARYGFTVESAEPVPIRLDKGKMIEGELYILRRGAPSP